MLSYRHAFHAGNHADVLKHLVLLQVLDYSTRKDKALCYLDTHAGAGMYALHEGHAAQNAEFADGIGRLWEAARLPAALASYVDSIRQFNPDGVLRYYPGSPLLAHATMRAHDRLHLFELHPNDYRTLCLTFESAGPAADRKRIFTRAEDGFTGSKACLPPPSRRGVMLIDPPYEEKHDYQRVLTALRESLARFATGTYIVWYPHLQRPEPARMLNQLKALQPRSWLHVSLTVAAPAASGFGMHGSGLFIINPPYQLPDILAENMPTLTALLGQDSAARYELESQPS